MATAPSPDQLESAILSQLHEASREESNGCFGRAEENFRAAFSLAQSHSIGTSLYARAAGSLGQFLHRLVPHTALAEKYLRIAATHALDPVDKTAYMLALVNCLLDKNTADGVDELLQTVQSSDAGTFIRVADARARLLLLQNKNQQAGTAMKQNVKAAEELIPNSAEHAEALLHLAEFREKEWDHEKCKALLMKTIEIATGCTLIGAVRLFARALCHRDTPHETTDSFKFLLSIMQKRDISPYTRAAVLVEMGDAYSWRRANNFAVSLYYQALQIYEEICTCSWSIVWLKMKIDARNSAERKLLWTKSELDNLSTKLPTVSSIIALRSTYTPQRYFLQQYIAKLEVLAESYSEYQGDALLTLCSLNGRNGRRIKGIQARMQQYQKQHENDDAVKRLKARYDHFCSKTLEKLNRRRYREQQPALLQSLRLPESLERFPAEVARAYLQLSFIVQWMHGIPKRVEKTDIDCVQTAVRLLISSAPASQSTPTALYRLRELQLQRGLYSAVKETCTKALLILETSGHQSWWTSKDVRVMLEEASVNVEAVQWLYQFASANLDKYAGSDTIAKVVFYLSDLEMKQGLVESAKSLLRRYIDRLPRSSMHRAEAKCKLGSLCMSTRESSEALSHYEECLDLLLAVAPNTRLICHVVDKMAQVHQYENQDEVGWMVLVCERLLSQPAANNRTAEVLTNFSHDLMQLSTDSLENLLQLAPRNSVACFALCCITLDCYKTLNKHAQALALLPLALAEYAHCQSHKRQESTRLPSYFDLSPHDLKEEIEKGMDMLSSSDAETLLPLSSHQWEFTVSSFSIIQWLAALIEFPQFLAPAYTRVEVALMSGSYKDGSLLISLITYYETMGRFKEIERTVAKLAHKPNWEYRGRAPWKIRACYER